MNDKPIDELEHMNNNMTFDSYIYRFLVRDGYSLNVTIAYHTLVIVKEEQKYIIFTVNTSSGLQTYLLKFTGPNAESDCVKITTELKNANRAVEEAEQHRKGVSDS
uniref:Retinoid-binding protein 7 n=1 Tax=Lygus hesperus TaxID=30085 RepID=A0A0A9X418_LYGHE